VETGFPKRSCVKKEHDPLGHFDVRDGVLVEGLALATVAEPGVETVGAEAGVEHDDAVAFAARVRLGEGEQPRADVFTTRGWATAICLNCSVC
jgi:hypothetical protein